MAGKLRTIGRVATLAALAMLMSACLKLDIDLTLSSEDTVSGSVVFAMDKALIELTGQSFDDLMAESAPFPEDPSVSDSSSRPCRSPSSPGRARMRSTSRARAMSTTSRASSTCRPA
jgi:hypothetical protein